MSTVVLRSATAPVPIALSGLNVVTVEARPDPAVVDELLPVIAVDGQPTIIVLGTDASLSAVLTHLMRTDRLDVPLGFVPTERSYGARRYATGSGRDAAKLALGGTPQKMPLIRDDTGAALVGRVTITGPDGEPLQGEAYVDDTLVVANSARALEVTANPTMPGLSARARAGKWRRQQWVEGRAMQLGTTGAVVVRDGTPDGRVVKRASFYRHHEPWLLLR